MAMPKSKEARMFYRASIERLTDARFIHEKANRTTAAVYLAGYAVECILKALVLSQLPKTDRIETIKQFRGSKAHDYDWLKTKYRESGGSSIPQAVIKAFVVVEDWGTEMRYNPRAIPPDEVEAFLAASETILKWADGRL
jgi:hypothetical protein